MPLPFECSKLVFDYLLPVSVIVGVLVNPEPPDQILCDSKRVNAQSNGPGYEKCGYTRAPLLG